MQNPQANISFVVVTYHTGPVLFDMIASVFRQPETLELILVNNGNPPEVEEKLQVMAQQNPALRLISGHGNIGFASGINKGAEVMKGEYLFILNPDCVLQENLAAAFVAESAKHPRPHMISCRILDEQGVEQSGSRRDVLTPLNALSEVFKLYLMFPDVPALARFNRHQDKVPDHTVPMPAVSGAVMFFPKDDYWRVGGFDNSYFLHVDDLDLCLRFNRAGGTIYFMPNPAITHIGGSSDAPKLKVELWKTKSFQRYFFKNFSREYPKILLWLVVAATWARFGLFAIKGWVKEITRKKTEKISDQS